MSSIPYPFALKEVLWLPSRKVSTQLVSLYEEIARAMLLPSADFSRAGCGELAAGAHIPILLPTRRFRPGETRRWPSGPLPLFPSSIARTSLR
jgi:hypothetical protein